ncbi:MAG TPA: FecR domain-containing protein [Novosphingobium sp.]|nr:FecR domain-containing protein [Novosphingobium sp.]
MFKPVISLGLLLSGGVALAADAPQVVGINSAILGDARISSPTAPQPRPAVLRARIALADGVQTGARSQLQVLLLDKSVFTVGANARLTIDRYVYDPNGGRSFSATVAQGAFRFMSGRADRRGTSSINTPIAAIGVRGTIVEGVIGPDAVAIARSEPGVPRNTPADPATASLIILRGPGAGTQAGLVPGAIDVTGGNHTVSLDQPLQAVYVPAPGAAPIGPFTISLPGLARVHALIFPSLASRPGLVRSGGGTPYPLPASDYGHRPPRGVGVLLGDPTGGQGPADGGRYIPGVPTYDPGAGGPQQGYGAPAGQQAPAQQPDPARKPPPPPQNPSVPPSGQQDPAAPPPPPPQVPGKP